MTTSIFPNYNKNTFRRVYSGRYHLLFILLPYLVGNDRSIFGEVVVNCGIHWPVIEPM